MYLIEKSPRLGSSGSLVRDVTSEASSYKGCVARWSLSDAGGVGSGSRGKAPGGGLKKYASEECLLSAGIAPEMDYHGGRTENDHLENHDLRLFARVASSSTLNPTLTLRLRVSY
ncbi:hypothetical protein BT96DRAFT_915853 [Gymnopus androsaceus JB14]|uniref:Uncharacterized protein n=1 Tax=Gymnopus androsaceus JB14 TaxID=1447944 RepID=A0A6A4I7T2_9AGAR|nr:hypothetical protein BT96DRAFT_915853 [Gymnopus androsaceus JB14]